MTHEYSKSPLDADLIAKLELEKPSYARVYDFFLGGYHNFEIDRKVAESLIAVYPDVRPSAICNRAFLRRAVQYLCTIGIDQFIDIGSGIPTANNTHEVAQAINPDAKVAYIDIDQVAIIHSNSILNENKFAKALWGDIRNLNEIFNNPEIIEFIDFKRPVAILMLAVLHFIPDNEKAYQIVNLAKNLIVSGSYLVIAHGTFDNAPQDKIDQLDMITKASRSSFKNRTLAEIIPFFEGISLVEPGIVHPPLWRPESDVEVFFHEPERSMNFVGVGKKL